MKGKGFTLIELLAVIVILAIIALIATPVVLNIIKDSKNSSLERSAELYLNQVKNEIARYNMNHPGEKFNPSECVVESYVEGLNCNDITINDGYTPLTIEININGTKPEAGSKIILSNGNIVGVADFIISGVQLTYTNGKISRIPSTICTRVTSSKYGNVPEGKYKVGDEYTCQVNDTTSYNFYILNTEGNKVNMIIDKSICSDGSVEKKSTNTCDTACISEEDYKAAGGTNWIESGAVDKGPITVLNYLNKATSSWTNIPNLSEKHKDEGGNFGTINISGKARLIYRSELNEVVKKINPTTPTLEFDENTDMQFINGVSTLDVFWFGNINTKLWISTVLNGTIEPGYLSGEYHYTIPRPVITLNKSNLQ